MESTDAAGQAVQVTPTIRSGLYVLGALLLGYLWLAWIHDPAIRRVALQVQQDKRDDSVHTANEFWKAQFLARDTARDDSLRKLSAGIRGARGEIARLKTVITGEAQKRDCDAPDAGTGDSLTRATAEDAGGCGGSVPPPVEIATRDSIIAFQDLTIAGLDSSVTLYQAMIFDRDTLIARRESEVLALTTARNNWRSAAHKKFVCVGGVGAVASIDGRVTAGFGGVCGIRF